MQPVQPEPVKVDERRGPVQPVKPEPVKVDERRGPVQPLKPEPVKVDERRGPVQPLKPEPVKVDERRGPVQPVKPEPVKVDERQFQPIFDRFSPFFTPCSLNFRLFSPFFGFPWIFNKNPLKLRYRPAPASKVLT